MAMISPEQTDWSNSSAPSLSRSFTARIAGTVIASGLGGALAGAIIFAGMWMTTALPLGPSDRVVELFTNAPPVSIEALRGGAIVAALFGFFVGAVGGAVYEIFHG